MARLKPRPFEARSTPNFVDESPRRGCRAWASRGKSPLVSAFPSTPEGWFPVKGKTRSHLNFESRPGVYDHCLLHGGLLKSALGCLTYSRIWCLSRGKRNILWPESCKGTELGKWSQVSRFQSLKVSGFEHCSMALRGGAGAIFWRGAGHGADENGRGSTNTARRQRHVDVFEDGLGGDSSYAVGGFDEVVSGTAGLFAAESVGKDERFGELTSSHQETGTVDLSLIHI